MMLIKQYRESANAKLQDHSMEDHYVDFAEGNVNEEAGREGEGLGDKAFLDLTDRKNDEFVYVY